MIISYHYEDTDIERQKKEIVNIINKNVLLKIKFIDYIKVYGVIFLILFLTTLPLLKNIVLFYIITSVIVLIYFITISVLYFFQFYEIKYDAKKEMLVIKKVIMHYSFLRIVWKKFMSKHIVEQEQIYILIISIIKTKKNVYY